MKKTYKAPNIDFWYELLDKPIPDPNGFDDFKYRAMNTISYYSIRYDKWCTVIIDDLSDGATGAFDIPSLSWWVHDKLCKECRWDDGTPVTNWQASQVLSDILKSEGRWCRARYWKYSTFLLGGGKIKKEVGWIKVK